MASISHAIQCSSVFFGVKEADIVGKTDYDFVTVNLPTPSASMIVMPWRREDHQATKNGSPSRTMAIVPFWIPSRRRCTIPRERSSRCWVSGVTLRTQVGRADKKSFGSDRSGHCHNCERGILTRLVINAESPT